MKRQSITRVPHFLSVKEAADLLMICDKTARKLIREKQLPFHQYGRKLVVSEDDLLSFIASRRRC